MNQRNELKKRIGTGLIGVPALLSVIWWGGVLGVAFLALVIALGMVAEFAEITLSLSDRKEKRQLLLLLTGWLHSVNFLMPQSEFSALVLLFLLFSSYFLLTASRHSAWTRGIHFQELMYCVFGLIYLAFLPLYLVRLSHLHQGLGWVICFFFLIWVGDSLAYFAGKVWGKRKLYPAVSPKKTIEGAASGLVGGILTMAVAKISFLPHLRWVFVVLIATLVGIFAQMGDLCESLLKRAFDRKDSGSILPGHGGFLDRFDSLVFSLPVMYACVRLLSGI